MKPIGTGSHGGAIPPPSTDGRRPARRASWFVSPVMGAQCPRGPTTPGRPKVYPLVTNISQAAVRNWCSGSRKKQVCNATGSAASSPQLRERHDHHHTEQAAQVARSDALHGGYMSFNCRTAGRPYHHPYKACAWTVDANCKWVGHDIHIGNVPETSFPNKG